MANPLLTEAQRKELYAPLFQRVVEDLKRTAGGDPKVMWAMRRKLAKELVYLERGTPMLRRKLQIQKMKEQQRRCAICGKALPERNAELDRFDAYLGYTPENTRLVHHDCHVEDQKKKNYA